MPLSMNIDMGYNFVNIVNTIMILFMVMGDVAGCGRVEVLGGGGLTGGRGGFMLRGLDSRWRGMMGGGAAVGFDFFWRTDRDGSQEHYQR